MALDPSGCTFSDYAKFGLPIYEHPSSNARHCGRPGWPRCHHSADLAGAIRGDTPSAGQAASPAEPAPAPSFRRNPKAFLQAKGFDVTFSWADIYQGMISGDPEGLSEHSGRLALGLTIDGEKIGLWRGFGISAIGEALYGDTVLLRTPILLPINTPVLFPAFGGREADVSVTVSQRFGQRADLTAGKINLSTILNRSPLLGGGGVDTFMHVLAAAPVSGITPPYLTGLS